MRYLKRDVASIDGCASLAKSYCYQGVFLALILLPSLALAHPGRTAADGCHNNKTTGQRHCHNSAVHTSSNASSSNSTGQSDLIESSKKTAPSPYKRANWGGWIDADRDCQNTRAEVLINHSASRIQYRSHQHCTVSHGGWVGEYSGQRFTDASSVDIDHIVPLKWAYTHGASGWSKAQKRQFANDSNNLAVVDKSLNRQKGAKGPSEWLPPRARCAYVQRFYSIAKDYNLNVENIKESNTFKQCQLF